MTILSEIVRFDECKKYEGQCSKHVLREIANKKTEQLHKVSSPCLDDHQFKQEGSRICCSQVVLKCLYFGKISHKNGLRHVTDDLQDYVVGKKLRFCSHPGFHMGVIFFFFPAILMSFHIFLTEITLVSDERTYIPNVCP